VDRLAAELYAKANPEPRALLFHAAAGDVEAVRELSFFYRRCIDLFVQWIYLMGLPENCLRLALADGWHNSHKKILQRTKTRAELVRWFRAANYQNSMLPDELTIWRGTSGASQQSAAWGYSWSTNRSTAAWFAMRHPQRGTPLVLRRTIKRSEVLYYSNYMHESECVVATWGPCAVDGDLVEWKELASAEQTRVELAPYMALAA
jgi:hypothetical protein